MEPSATSAASIYDLVKLSSSLCTSQLLGPQSRPSWRQSAACVLWLPHPRSAHSPRAETGLQDRDESGLPGRAAPRGSVPAQPGALRSPLRPSHFRSRSQAWGEVGTGRVCGGAASAPRDSDSWSTVWPGSQGRAMGPTTAPRKASWRRGPCSRKRGQPSRGSEESGEGCSRERDIRPWGVEEPAE